MPHVVIRDPELSLQAKGLFALIASLPEDTSLAEIAEHMDAIDAAHIPRLFSELLSRDYLAVNSEGDCDLP